MAGIDQDLSCAVAHQRVHRCQRVIQPGAGKSGGKDEGRVDQVQRLVEIGIVLRVHRTQLLGRQGLQQRIRDRIQITDHQIGPVPQRDHLVRATIGGHQMRCMAQRPGQRIGAQLARTGKRDPLMFCVSRRHVISLSIAARKRKDGHILGKK
tara:strand:+ start:1461 stop:1916 length:456 start_codon:yes stop_codon:yes gene_type:complete